MAAFSDLRVIADRPESFEYVTYSRELAYLTASCTLVTPCAFELSGRRRQGVEPSVYVFATGLSGLSSIRNGSDEWVCRPGQLAVLTSDHPVTTQFWSCADPAGLEIKLKDLGTEWPACGGRALTQTLLTRSVSHFVRGLVHAAIAHSEEIGPEAELAAIDLIRVVLDRQSPNLRRVRDNKVLVRAAADDVIARRCTDPEFGAADIASELQVSRRHLYRYFADGPKPLSDLIAEQRIAIACDLLDAQQPHTLAAVAQASGFGSVATFRSRFRDEVGLTPSEYRRRENAGRDFPARSPRRVPARPVLDPLDEVDGG